MQGNIYKVFLASPSDTKDERIIVEKIIAEINGTLGEHHNFIVKLLKWESDSYPDFGIDGQDVINKELGSDYDIFIGIMWKKFGTPTNRAESGTEEEFTRAYDKFKTDKNLKIMFYFNTAPIPQNQLDLEQFKKVKLFKEKFSDLGGYYWHYESLENFEKYLRQHLQKQVLNLLSINKNTVQNQNTTQISLVPEINSNFLKYLEDPEANFSHSKVDSINLSDIYISPDLRDLNERKKASSYKTINVEDLISALEVQGTKYVLIGDDSAGKTATVKFLFRSYFNYGLIPIIIDGSDINNNIRSEAIVKLAESKIIQQYETPFELKDFHKDRFIIIIDNFHKAAKSNNKYWPVLMKNIESQFINIIVTGDTVMPIENISKKNPFDKFDIYSILEFGPKFRSELVFKWYTLGIEERHLDKNELLRKHDIAIAHIKTIMGKNYIPGYPFYLLSILQAMEAGNIHNTNYSIYGFYYELIINECFNRAVKDKKEISLYYNYLANFSFYLFDQQTNEISMEEFRQFHIAYCKLHDLSYSLETIIQTFENAKLLNINHKIHIKEKYVYYFFVAKYIANNIGKASIKDIITKMSDRIFRDEYANILLFVTHLSKDEFIIEELIKNANSIFEDTLPVNLEEDIKAINNLVIKLPDQVLELVDVDQKRVEELEEQERVENERREKQFDKEKYDYDDINLDADISKIDFFAKITLALKTIDILGQVTKKHWGEIDGEKKLELVSATYFLGLRTLNVYLQFLQKNTKAIIQHLSELVIEKHIKDRFKLKELIEEKTRDFIFRLCFMSSWGITKRVSTSIGYDKLKNSFERLLKMNSTNAVKLIDLSIKLGYSGIPMNLIEQYKKEMANNNLSYAILRNLVIDHLYMFDTTFKEKDQVCSILEIGLKEQLKIDATSKVKRKV